MHYDEDGEIIVEEDRIGLILLWKADVVAVFVKTLNTQFPASSAAASRPNWMTQGRFVMTPQNLMDDIAKDLAHASGGESQQYGGVFISPNTVPQFGNLMRQLGRIEYDPFMQQVLKAARSSEGVNSNSGTDYDCYFPFILAELKIVSSRKQMKVECVPHSQSRDPRFANLFF